MRKIVLTLIISLYTVFTFCQEISVAWEKLYGGLKSDYPVGIFKTNNGYILAGSTSSTSDIFSANPGAAKGYLMWLDSQGDIKKINLYGGSSGDSFTNIIPVNDSVFYVLGIPNSHDGILANNPYSNPYNSIWVLKMDTAGNVLWHRVIGSNSSETPMSGRLTQDGGLLITGLIWGTDIQNDITVRYGWNDFWIVKMAPDGEVEMEFTIGSINHDFVEDAIELQNGEGGYLVVGSSWPDIGGNLDCELVNSPQAVAVRFDRDKNIIWQRCYGGSGIDGFKRVLEIEDGYVFSGYTNKNGGDVSGCHQSGITYDIWFVKTDFDGNIKWQVCRGGYNDEDAFNLSTSDNGSFFIFGTTRAPSGGGEVSVNYASTDNQDFWFIKIDSLGQLIWEKSIKYYDGNQRYSHLTFEQINENHFIVASDVLRWESSVGKSQRDILLFQLVDCSDTFNPATPTTPTGPSKACSASSNPGVYTVPAVSKQTTEWKLEPPDAGSIITGKDSLLIYWSYGYEGTVAITARGINDCGASAWSQPIYTQVETCAGISTHSLSGLKIWPNPAKTHLNIEMPSNVQLPVNILISDVSGRTVISQQLVNHQGRLDVSNLGQGVYFWNLHSNPGFFGKFLIY